MALTDAVLQRTSPSADHKVSSCVVQQASELQFSSVAQGSMAMTHLRSRYAFSLLGKSAKKPLAGALLRCSIPEETGQNVGLPRPYRVEYAPYLPMMNGGVSERVRSLAHPDIPRLVSPAARRPPPNPRRRQRGLRKGCALACVKGISEPPAIGYLLLCFLQE